MNRKQFFLTLLVAIISGFLGGVTIAVSDAASTFGPAAAAMIWINDVNGESVWSAP